MPCPRVNPRGRQEPRRAISLRQDASSARSRQAVGLELEVVKNFKQNTDLQVCLSIQGEQAQGATQSLGVHDVFDGVPCGST